MFGARKANLSCSRVFQFGEIRKCRMILDRADAFQTKLMRNTEHTNTRTLSHIIKKRTDFSEVNIFSRSFGGFLHMSRNYSIFS